MACWRRPPDGAARALEPVARVRPGTARPEAGTRARRPTARASPARGAAAPTRAAGRTAPAGRGTATRPPGGDAAALDEPPADLPPMELPPPSQLPPAEAPPPQAAEPGRQGWFSRLKAGLARSTAKLTDSVTAVFTKRKLDEAALEELEETLIAADLGVAASRPHRRRLPPDPLRQGGYRRGGEGDAGRGDRRDPRPGRPAPGDRPRPRAACRAGGRRQRHRQDDDDRQARPAVSRPGAEGRLRRRRHLPRRRRRTVAGLGRPHRRTLLPARQAWRGCRGPRLRRADRARGQTVWTCCWSIPPGGCTTNPR